MEYRTLSMEGKRSVLDYSVIGIFAPQDAEGHCVYCNHCVPCPVGLNVGLPDGICKIWMDVQF